MFSKHFKVFQDDSDDDMMRFKDNEKPSWSSLISLVHVLLYINGNPHREPSTRALVGGEGHVAALEPERGGIGELTGILPAHGRQDHLGDHPFQAATSTTIPTCLQNCLFVI